MGLGLVRSESIAVDPETGEIHDLTIRSFGVVRAVDTPTIEIDVLADERPAVNGSDAVMAAVAAAVWLADGTRRRGRRPGRRGQRGRPAARGSDDPVSRR